MREQEHENEHAGSQERDLRRSQSETTQDHLCHGRPRRGETNVAELRTRSVTAQYAELLLFGHHRTAARSAGQGPGNG
jgi:protein required for attachment to host cells